jgi:hypothetical protein
LRINRGWKGPFALSFDPRLTYDVRKVVDEKGRHGRFCHVLVHNSSTADVPGCVGTLRSIAKRIAGGRYVPVLEYRRRLQLRWANVGSFALAEIEAHDIARLDLCYTLQGNQEFRIEVPGGLGVQTNYGPGIYRVTIRASAPGAIHTDESFLIIHDGRWDAVTIKQDVEGMGNALLTPDEIARVAASEAAYASGGDIHTSGGPSLMVIGPAPQGGTITSVDRKGTLESNSTASVVMPQKGKDPA